VAQSDGEHQEESGEREQPKQQSLEHVVGSVAAALAVSEDGEHPGINGERREQSR
jgi:hypothetical protein